MYVCVYIKIYNWEDTTQLFFKYLSLNKETWENPANTFLFEEKL